MTATNIT